MKEKKASCIKSANGEKRITKELAMATNPRGKHKTFSLLDIQHERQLLP